MHHRRRLLSSLRPVFRGISQAAEEAPTAGGRVITVRGGPGSGKTTLLRALQTELRERSQLVIGAGWTQCIPYAALRQLAHAADPPPIATEHTDDAAHRLSLAEELVGQHRAWESAPPVILLDDPHLMDAASLQVLSQLAHQISTTSTVLVISVSSDPKANMDPDFGRLADDPGTLQLQIPALGADDVLALARERGFHDINSQGVAAVLEYADGRLRVAEEILAEVPQGAWPADPESLPLPRSVVRDVLEPIRKSQSGALWRLVATLAVLGEPSDLSRIGQVAGVEDLAEAVDLGVASGVVRESRAAGLSQLELIHPAAQRIVTVEMRPSERRALHARAAEYVEHPEDQLFHLSGAAQGQDRDLADALKQAAVAAEYQGRWRDSARLHFAASGVLPRSTHRDGELLKGIDALASAGNVAQALPWLGVAKSIAPSPERDVVLANLALHRGKAAEAHDLLQRAAAAQPKDQEVHAQIALRRTLDALVRWNGDELSGWADRAMELSPSDSPTYLESQAMRGVGLAAQGHLCAATATIRELAAENVIGAHSQRFHLCAGWVSLLAGNLREAVRALESAVPTQQLRGSLRISLWAQGWLARAQFMLGEWDDALRTADEGLRQCHEAGIDLVTPLLHWTSAEVRLSRGQPTDEVLGGTRSRAFFSDYLAMQVPERCTRAISAYVRGDHEGRAAALRPLLHEDPWTAGRGSFWPWHADLVDALVAADCPTEAQQVATDFHRFTPKASSYVRALAEAARARVAGATGDVCTAEEHFEKSLLLISGDQYPTERARILLSRGQVLRRANRRREAMESLERAREFYLGVDARVLVDRCEQELRATGMAWGSGSSVSSGDARGAAVGGAVMLTPQELSIADLVVQGMTNSEVARELFIAEKTVQYHLTRIYGKFRIRSRTELTTVHFAEGSRPI